MTNTEHQKGVALLFALGILSLILVMGLAFLGNSLISQKIAFNSQESSVSRFLARSAVDRALAHLTLFNLIQARDHATFYASDASSVFSRISTGSLEVAGDIQKAGTALAAIGQDQLSGNDSKLNVEKKYDTPWYWGKNSAAKWIYVHQNGVESAGDTTDNTSNPIVARYAYQVLPQTSLSRISLYGVTSGASGIAGITPAAANPRIPHFHRWGADVDELVIPGLDNMFLTYWGDETSEAVAGQYEFDNFINLLSSSSAPNPFYGKSRNIENRKRWLRNIFVEGKGRVAREAYTDGYNWYPRFNLGKVSSGSDAWYSRFLRSGENDSNLAALRNSPDVLDRLTAPAANLADCKFDDSKVRDNDYLTATTPNPIGLPFLRSIGDGGTGAGDAEIGAFPSVESLRKQVAANLNDYCDEDSIPTSDQPASEWKNKLNDTTDLPSYTGNEATPYINEIGLGFRLQETKFINGTEEYNFQAKLSAEVIAELIRVYKTIVPDISTVQLYGRVKNLAVTFRVSVQGTASGTFTKDDGNPGKVEGLVLTYENTSTEAESAKFEGQDFTVKFDTGVINSGPYWVKNATIGENSTVDVKVNLYEKLKTLAQNKDSGASGKSVSFNVVPEKVKVEITKVSFNFGNLVLTAKKVDKPETDAEIGIDFVKFLPVLGATESFSIKTDDAVIENNDLSKIGVFQVPLMQTIDPRQNLIARFGSDASSVNVKNSDWYFFNERKSALFKDDSENWEWENLSTRVVAGGKDLDNFSNPKDPKWADGTKIGDHKDTEETDDPAWQGDDKGKHISTAVIRNAPMRSPWELGFIHRGIPFQTINLKKAGGIDGGTALDDVAHDAANFANWTEGRGTRYEYGDAGILDQIKMTEFNKSYGKIDMRSLLVTTNPDWWISAGSGETVEPTEISSNLCLKI